MPHPVDCTKTDLKTLVQGIRQTENIELQTTSVEQAARICQRLTEVCVEALQEGSNSYLIAERLGRFGSLAAAPLAKALNTTDDNEVKVLSALILYNNLGSDIGLSILLDEVRNGGYSPGMAARSLVSRHDPDIGDAIVSRLRAIDMANLGKSFASDPNKDIVVCLLRELKKLNIEIPRDVIDAIVQQPVPVEVLSELNKQRIPRWLTDIG